MEFETTHRPWPLPDGSWMMFQQWDDLLFAHWPLTPDTLRAIVPAALELEIYGGQGWIGIVPFKISNARIRFTPPMPWLSSFPELNVRTYVTYQDKPGVYFFSLDATSLPAVLGARQFFKLPYYTADMDVWRDDPYIRYSSRRIDPDGEPAALVAAYRPAGHVNPAERGTLEYFLTERYCLYTADPEGVHRCEIHHDPWPLQAAGAEFESNTMTAPLGICLPDMNPVLHFSSCQRTYIWPLSLA